MSTTSRPPVPIALGSGSSGTEEGRAFHQGRLALYGKWIFLVSGGFLVFFGVLRAGVGVELFTGHLYHAIGTTLAGVIWAVGSRTRLTMGAMSAIDIGGTWLICASFAMMSFSYGRTMAAFGVHPAPVIYVGLLAISYTLIARAIALPATAARSAIVGTGAMAPMAAAVAGVLAVAPPSPMPDAVSFVDALTWMIAAVAMSVVASRVIFGLQTEIAEKRRLGQYTLDEKIGEGGMGVVYRAHHAMLRRPTAVKLLPPEKAGNENLLRFEREVQLTAGLSHPNTVAIFDYGRTVEGVFYYAMEYLDGINLDQLVARDGALPEGRVISILRQVSGALAEAHDVGLVHRDVKPANIILCERGGVPDVAKVVDFGLVKRFRPDHEDVTRAVTVERTLLGTPMYMAPESVGGDEVDARSDLYALGAVAYLLITGTPLFQGRSVVEICAHHLHTPPEPPSRRLGHPVASPGLERLVMQCLAKSPDDRPASARAIGRALASMPTSDWSEDDAAGWWLTFRRQTPRRDIPVRAAHVPVTVQRAAGSGHTGTGQ